MLAFIRIINHIHYRKTRVDNNVETYMRIMLVEFHFSLALHTKSRIEH